MENIKQSKTIKTTNYNIFLQTLGALLPILMGIKALNSDFTFNIIFVTALVVMAIIPLISIFFSLLIAHYRKCDHQYLVKGGKYCDEGEADA